MASIYICKLQRQRQPRNACSTAGSDVDARRRKRKAIVRNFVDPLRQNVKYERHGGDNDSDSDSDSDGGRWEVGGDGGSSRLHCHCRQRERKSSTGEHPTKKLFSLLLLLLFFLLLVLSAVLLLKVQIFFF